MARVVTETDIEISGSRASRRRDSVVFPAPEGEESTSRSPRRLMSEAGRALFKVLHLLAQLIDHRFELEPDAADLLAPCLGAQRVGLAVELLGKEVELAADRLRRREKVAARLDMRVEPIDFL